MAKGLSKKQRAFVEHYLECWDSRVAALRAGYSSTTVAYKANNLMQDERIKAAISERLDQLVMSADEVLKRLGEHARGNLGDFVDPFTGQIDLVRAQQKGVLHLVKSYSNSYGPGSQSVRIELYSAQSALQLIGKNHGLFADKVRHEGADGGPIQIIEIDPGYKQDDS